MRYPNRLPFNNCHLFHHWLKSQSFDFAIHSQLIPKNESKPPVDEERVTLRALMVLRILFIIVSRKKQMV